MQPPRAGAQPTLQIITQQVMHASRKSPELNKQVCNIRALDASMHDEKMPKLTQQTNVCQQLSLNQHTHIQLCITPRNR
jgi:hypothetical protein